jgi:putative spermidine/putrescine transport system permease protein
MSAVTIAFTLALMVPTQVLLHLKMPRMRGVVEVICLLPLVFPPIVLVVGVTSVYGWAQPDDNGDGSPLFRALVWVRDDHHPLLLVLLYAVMALPFVYRTIDAGLRSIDVATLTEASRSLGASWWTTIVGVLVASLRTSLVNAAFLIFALAMGEYTVSSILLYEKPFAVWLVNLPTQSGQVQAAISVLSLVLVEAILLVFAGGIGIGGRSRNDRKAMA